MRSVVLAAGLASGALCLPMAALAFPSAPTDSMSSVELAPTFVAEGCGPGFHRGPGGRCFPNEEPRRVCPRGTHLGPEGRECRPNF